MKIVSLTAENIKRLTAVHIEPAGNVVTVSGKNGAGKTSVLDSIYWALAGASGIQGKPIRHGETEARITLDLGEVIVTRFFEKGEEDDFTTKLEVKSADGAKFPSPQKMLDQMLGALSFDPLQFARMAPKDQAVQVQGFVKGFDFAATEAAIKADYDERREVNRKAKEARAAAARIELPTGERPALVDEEVLIARIASAGKHNEEIAARRMRREAVFNEIKAIVQKLDTLQAERQTLQERLDSAPQLPDPIEVDSLVAELEAARKSNALAHAWESADGFIAEAEAHENHAEALTAAIEERDLARRQAIAKAKIPGPNVSLTPEGVVTLNGIPFDQASSAEKLRASIALAMAANPKLRVILARDASLLDSDSMAILTEMAQENDCQVWIETVADAGSVGFVIENGKLKGGHDGRVQSDSGTNSTVTGSGDANANTKPRAKSGKASATTATDKASPDPL